MSPMEDPYLRFGLTRNPFARSNEEYAEGLWLDRGLPERISPGGSRFVQVIGPSGAGKTAHLARWRRLDPGPYRLVPQGPGRFLPPPLGPIAYWDEADRLPRLLLAAVLRLAARTGATIAAGTHADLGGDARAAGLLVDTWRFGELDPVAVAAWAARRIAAARLAERTALELDEETAARIAAGAGGSWRTVADLLHVWAAERAAG